jgi:hypothetical protein
LLKVFIGAQAIDAAAGSVVDSSQSWAYDFVIAR